jgi:hypothetical protein
MAPPDAHSGVQGFIYEIGDGDADPVVAGAVVKLVSGDRPGDISQTLTDEDGAYHLELPEGTYAVEVVHTEFAPWHSGDDSLVIEARKLTLKDMWLERRGPQGFNGVVWERLPDGSEDIPVPGATLTFTSEDWAVSESMVTEVDGGYSIGLPPARYRVRVEADGFEPYWTDQGFFVLRENQWSATNFFLTRTAQDGTGIHGTVSRRLDGDVAGGGLWGAIIWLVSETGERFEVIGNTSGYFSKDLEPGAYRFMAFQYDSETLVGGQDMIVVEDGSYTRADLLLDEISERTGVDGKVLDACVSDVYLAGVGSAMLTFTSEDRSISKFVLSTHNVGYLVGPGNGRYQVGLPEGIYNVNVSHPGYASESFSIEVYSAGAHFVKRNVWLTKQR